MTEKRNDPGLSPLSREEMKNVEGGTTDTEIGSIDHQSPPAPKKMSGTALERLKGLFLSDSVIPNNGNLPGFPANWDLK